MWLIPKRDKAFNDSKPAKRIIEALKQFSRMGSSLKALMIFGHSNAIGQCRLRVCLQHAVSNLSPIKKLINRFNHWGVDGLIVKKQHDAMALINWKKIIRAFGLSYIRHY